MPRQLISSGSPFEQTYAYSRAVAVGDWCFTAGTTGYDYAAMRMPDDPAEQCRNALTTIQRALAEAGFELAHVVRTHVIVTDAFEHVLRLDATESKAHYNIGALFLSNGQPAMAEDRFRAAIAIDAFHRNAHLELAEILRRSGRCGEAVALFERTLEITPGAIAPRQHLALCHLRLGQYAPARTLLEDGLAANPDHIGFIDALARVLAASPEADVRDGARALRLVEGALARQRRTEMLETLAMAQAELGRFDEAVSWQNQAIRAVEQMGHAAYLAHLNENLRRYQQGTPCRTPWPEFMYEL